MASDPTDVVAQRSADALANIRRAMREDSRKEAEAMMALGGFMVRATWELANDYWPDHPDFDGVRRPWWLFLTEIGPVRVGRRKRVIELDWAACALRAVVTADDVTKAETYVHAWSTEKAVEYLKALRAAWERSLLPISDASKDWVAR